MITIAIPTKNRSDFLDRLLNYYAACGFQHWISIGDSSEPAHAQRTKNTIQRLSGKIKVKYYEHPNESGPTCMQKLFNDVTTPYAVYSGDDDFFVPDSLEKCIEFLENHKEYSGANGKAVLFSVNNKKEICSISGYKLKSIEADTASQRFRDFMMDYFVAFFSVYRADVCKRMLRDASLVPTKSPVSVSFMGEVMPSSLSVILGKIKQLDCLYLFRQMHERRNYLLDVFDLITSLDWPTSYRAFYDSLAEALIQQDNITLDNTHEIIKQSFWFQLNKGLNRKFQISYPSKFNRIKGSIKSSIKKQFPALANISMQVKHSAFAKNNISLSSLLSPRSLYCKDFMPLYNVFRE